MGRKNRSARRGPDNNIAIRAADYKKETIAAELSGRAPVDKRVINSGNYIETLCFSCSKATPLLCRWIKNGNREGLTYKVKNLSNRHHPEQIIITGCDNYAPGPLPPPAWSKLDADILAGVMGN